MSERYEQLPFSLPPGATEVLLVRHGASQAHVPGQSFPEADGHGDPPLAESGLQQAELVGPRLASLGPSKLFVTTLQRTHQTAAPAARLTGLTPVVVPELREVHLGEWEGGELRVRAAQGDPLFLQMLTDQRWDVIPGAETNEQFIARIQAGIARVVEETGPDARSAAVVHGGVIAFVAHLATGSKPFAFLGVENASISRLVVFADGRWYLRVFNDTCHLEH